jgi:hypothetical protein
MSVNMLYRNYVSVLFSCFVVYLVRIVIYMGKDILSLGSIKIYFCFEQALATSQAIPRAVR